MLRTHTVGQVYYYTGAALFLAALIGAELIWLPAPIAWNGGVEWIDMINWLQYGVAVIPLCWVAGGIKRLKRAGGGRLLYLTRWGVAIAGIIAAASLAVGPQQLIALFIGSIALSLILLFADLLITEYISRKAVPWRSGAAFAIMLVLLSATLWPTGKMVTYPGMTLNLNRYAHMDGGESGGTIDGVLVFDRPAVLADSLYGRLFPQYVFQPKPENQPSLTQIYAEAVEMKNDANSIASAIALQKVGLGKGVIYDGVLVAGIVDGSPAQGILRAGDIMDSVNGTLLSKVEELLDYMSARVKPGDAITVEIRRNNKVMKFDVPTVAAADDTARAVMGISVETKIELDTPRKIRYTKYTAHAGGPSHGAMLTLAFMDQLTPGGLTNGHRIAGTGTIEIDGSIGMVGGIPQKAYAVSRTEADVFFVPAEGAEAAIKAAPTLNIVAVNHIDDVLEWLKKQN
ncbi:PDZ domain-containing protein [Paenibacillus sp. CAU 1782]